MLDLQDCLSKLSARQEKKKENKSILKWLNVSSIENQRGLGFSKALTCFWVCYCHSLTVINQQARDNRNLGKSCCSICVCLYWEVPLWWKMPFKISSDNCVGSNPRELNEKFLYYDAHGNLSFSLTALRHWSNLWLAQCKQYPCKSCGVAITGKPESQPPSSQEVRAILTLSKLCWCPG